mgnify:CR=1 FL=1
MTVSANNVRNILSKNILVDGFSPIMDFEKSKGSYLVDQITGDSYLDMFSMFASASVGYNHPKILWDGQRQKTLNPYLETHLRSP